jgi:hypothetical protein
VKSFRILRQVPALLALSCLLGCSTTSNPPAAGQPKTYLFPKCKYLAEPEFSLTNEDRKLALRELRRKRGELLYELIIDRQGNVTKIRVAKALEGNDMEFFTIGFMQRLREHKFSPSRMDAPYRNFYYPMNVESEFHFPGSDVFMD